MSSKADLNEKFISFLEQTKGQEHKSVTRLNDRVLIVDGLNTFICSGRTSILNNYLSRFNLHSKFNLEEALQRREAMLRLVDPICLGDFRWVGFQKRLPIN